MTLKAIVRQKLLQEVIQPHQTKAGSRANSSGRILLLDHLSTKIISACFTMHEIVYEGITLVEDLSKIREPIPAMEGIYLITPRDSSVRALMNDFPSPSDAMYKCAHVYFTEECPDQLIDELRNHLVSKFIKTLKEINIAFLPLESQVFSLDNQNAFQSLYNPGKSTGRRAELEPIAGQIATLCATLGEYPQIRYRNDNSMNAKMARLVQKKLNAFKADDPKMGEGAVKGKSQLIILDRGFDCVSPLLHELTLQAMAYDLLPIKDNVYKHETASSSVEKQVFLDEDDDLWVELRHQHIADASKHLGQRIKEFVGSKHNLQTADKASLKDLALMIKKFPEYQKEWSKYSTHSQLVEDCLKIYGELNVDKLCKVEQELAMATDLEGKIIKGHLKNMAPILSDPKVSDYDKVRIISLYILSTKGGISEENLDKLCQRAQISSSDRNIVTNLAHLGLNVISDENRKKVVYSIPRKERKTVYDLSRWTPVLKDVAEDAIGGKLDQKQFPFLLTGKSAVTSTEANSTPAALSARYRSPYWHCKENQQKSVKTNVPRVIIFIIGGITYSEMRSACEVTAAAKNWEVIVGSTHILTPGGFLSDLKKLGNN